ncbi:MAG TPA: STAS domain-containing protein, partial [Rugosimonospora sp.]|nr:STAS domain-containing protein [Rugosimonospora sp.]
PAEPTASAWTYLLDGVAVVRAIGEFDVYTGPVLGRELDRAAASGRRAVLVDLGRVSFMDLGGLAPLRAAAVDTAGGDHRLLLVQVPGPVQRLIDVSGAAGEMAAAAATGEVRRTG